MKDTRLDIEQLAARARAEAPPPINALPGVMRRIRRETPESLRPLVWVAAGSVLAAAACVLAVAPVVSTLSDPVSAFFQLPLGGP